MQGNRAKGMAGALVKFWSPPKVKKEQTKQERRKKREKKRRKKERNYTIIVYYIQLRSDLVGLSCV